MQYVGIRKKMYEAMTDKSNKPKVQAMIDENLRRVYDDALKEDIPDRFKQLLDELRQKEVKK